MKRSRQAEHKKAEQRAREAVALLRGDAGADAALARALRELAWALYLQGNTADAESAAREAYGLFTRLPSPPEKDLADCLSTLGGILFDKADLTGAAKAYEDTLAYRRRAYGPSHPRTVSASANLAAVWIAQGELAKAEAACREIVALDRQQLGPEHPSLGNSLSNLGAVLYLQQKYYEAENYDRQALAIVIQMIGVGQQAEGPVVGRRTRGPEPACYRPVYWLRSHGQRSASCLIACVVRLSPAPARISPARRACNSTAGRWSSRRF